MERIELLHTLPQVFQGREPQSQIWLQDVTFQKGQTYLVEANSGTGKSSLCSYIIGYRKDYLGTIRFDGKDIRKNRVSEWTSLRERNLSLLFQELRLFPELTAMENVQIKNGLTGHKNRQEIETWFERLGIADKMSAKVDRMSYGQQQRVAMIRALVQPFDFLLVDEPISHLDDENSAIMGEIMMEEVRKQEAGVIVTSIGKHMSLSYDKTFCL
ncbi:MAG: ATP-binding cassette domain-containing protein [Bacteroidaceae bacterium]|nr:ATP-binding cassette domain-containing protein [Bacteroidaceae bacterium]